MLNIVNECNQDELLLHDALYCVLLNARPLQKIQDLKRQAICGRLTMRKTAFQKQNLLNKKILKDPNCP